MSDVPYSLLGNLGAVFEFELRRSLSIPRMVWWCVLASFPVAIATLILSIPEAREEVPSEFWSGFLFALIPMLISMLGTFLWTTPAVSAELERQSWVYLAVRPYGRAAVVLGKYLAAVTWVLPAALVAATAAIWLIHQTSAHMADDQVAFRTWWTTIRLSCLSVPAYSAIYLALGTIFTRRSMVIAVAYTLVLELVVSWVPALINKLTIQYRLRALFFHWSEIDISKAGQLPPIDIFSSAPPWVHVTILSAWVAGLLCLSVWLVGAREYVVSESAE